MEKIKMIFKQKSLYVFFLITMIYFGIYLKIQYAPDTYNVFASDLGAMVKHFFSCGRFVTGLWLYVSDKILNLSEIGIYLTSYFIAIIAMTISLNKVYKIFKEESKSKLLVFLATILILINIFSIELFVYIEKGIMVLSVLFSVLAFEQVVKMLKGDKKIKCILIASLWMFLANASYQGAVGIFAVLSFIYILKYSKNIKDFILSNINIGIIYIIPAVLNLLIIRLFFANERVQGEIILSESIQKIFASTESMIFKTYGIIPENLLVMLSIALIIIIIIYKSIKSKENKLKKAVSILGILYIVLGTIIITVAPQLLQDTSSIWFVPRSTYPFAAIIGILLMYLTIKYELIGITEKVIAVICIVYMGIQLNSFISIVIDNHIVNYIDEKNTKNIIEQIESYEQTTGVKVEEIAFYRDQQTSYTYDGIKTIGDMNIKSLFPEWSAQKIIEYFGNRDLILINKNEEFIEVFTNFNWENYSEEQIKFIDNEVHICLY